MRPRIELPTLTASDLERALAFHCDGLRLPTEGITGQRFEDGAVVFFLLDDGLVLAPYPAASLAEGAGIGAGARLGAVSIGHLVGSKAEVDAVTADALRAGATVTDPARDRSWGGHSGHFHDPDGHLRELAWNPGWPVEG